MKKNKLIKQKELIIQKNNNILKAIREKNDIRFSALEYKKYKNNIPVALGIITFIGSQFFISKVFDYTLIKTSLISIIPSITVTSGMQTYFNYQKNKHQKKFPRINLETYDIEEEGKKINDMFEESFCLTDELGNINNELNEIKNEKQKVKVMTLTRKK